MIIPLSSKSVQGQLVAAPLEDLPPAQASFGLRIPHLHGTFSKKKEKKIAENCTSYLSTVGAFNNSECMHLSTFVKDS